jgi:cellulose synthase/poly-beta-1,6-N-acetylglucosamine synthase-like glycosyltransferase
MTFSVIIPTYNRRELLRTTLNSVLSQTDAEPEIIVVDDGSTDGTVEMLESFAPRVRTLRQKNGGPGAARNLGLKNCGGEYIAFLDSDDLWFPWTLKTYQAVIERNNRPAFVAGCPFRFGDETQLTVAKNAAIQINSFPDYYASGDEWRWFSASSFVIRRDALSAGGGITFEASDGEDADLAMALGVSPGFVQIKSPCTFAYRELMGTLTTSANYRFRGARLWLEKERAGRYPGGRSRRAERRRILSRHIRPVSFLLLNAGDVGRAWQVYRWTWTWNLGEGRLRYLVGVPAIALMRLLTGPRAVRKTAESA